MEHSEEFSCLDCIWCDQCRDVQPCMFFDNGESEIVTEQDEEQQKSDYYDAFLEYIQEFNN
jgi:hypothetical protein